METCWDIFHIDGESGLRGGERQLLYLAASLRAAGHRNTVVCRARPWRRRRDARASPRRRCPF